MTTEVRVSSAPKVSMSFLEMVDAEASGEAAIVIARAAADAVMIRVVFIMSTIPRMSDFD